MYRVYSPVAPPPKKKKMAGEKKSVTALILKPTDDQKPEMQ